MDFPAEPRGSKGKRSSSRTSNYHLKPQILGTPCREAAPRGAGSLGTNSSPGASSHTPMVTGSHPKSPLPSQPWGTFHGPECLKVGLVPMEKFLPFSQNHRGDAFRAQPLRKFGHKRALKHHQDRELQSPFCPFPRARSRADTISRLPCLTPWNPCPSLELHHLK